jgi:hypothetical protein
LETVVGPLGQSGKIKKTEIHRFFEFIDKLPGNKHVGYMGLNELNLISRMTIRFGLHEELDIVRKILH